MILKVIKVLKKHSLATGLDYHQLKPGDVATVRFQDENQFASFLVLGLFVESGKEDVKPPTPKIPVVPARPRPRVEVSPPASSSSPGAVDVNVVEGLSGEIRPEEEPSIVKKCPNCEADMIVIGEEGGPDVRIVTWACTICKKEISEEIKTSSGKTEIEPEPIRRRTKTKRVVDK